MFHLICPRLVVMNQAINLIDNLAVRKERLHVSHGVTRTDDGDDEDY